MGQVKTPKLPRAKRGSLEWPNKNFHRCKECNAKEGSWKKVCSKSFSNGHFDFEIRAKSCAFPFIMSTQVDRDDSGIS